QYRHRTHGKRASRVLLGLHDRESLRGGRERCHCEAPEWSQRVQLTGRPIVVALFIALVAPVAGAGDAALPEAARLRLERTLLERAVLRERLQRLQVEATLLQMQDAAKAREWDALVDAVARETGRTPDSIRAELGMAR